jgi:hypothetical protein
MATKNMVEQVLELAGKFVVAQKGTWQHADWEAFLGKAAALGVPITDETKRSLGNILESCKEFLCTDGPCAPAPKKAAAKPKAKAKSR